MNRRRFLAVVGAAGAGLAGCRFWPDDGFWNPCLPASLPPSLADHAVVRGAWAGIDPAQLWDGHVHLLGTGDSGSGVWINPRMDSLWHPVQYVQKKFYEDASCFPGGRPSDAGYVERLLVQAQAFPRGARFLLLAFDYYHDAAGRRVPKRSPFHVPNDYARDVARRHPERFGWIASVHPYRPDAVAAVQSAAADGARAIKWLPSAMGIDPAAPACDRVYAALAGLDLPLLTHAGHELAVHSSAEQTLGNPLRLRRALDHGVRVIVAHCASLGSSADLDRGANGPELTNFELFARLMDDPRYHDRLFGDISAMAQLLRGGVPLQTLIRRRDWHARLLHGSDYPLPAVMPLFSLRHLAGERYITDADAEILRAIRRHNPLLFDFVLKRTLKVDGQGFGTAVFETRRVFAGDRAVRR